MTNCCLLLLFGLLPQLLMAQEDLFLEKPPFKRIQIEPGDSIRMKIQGDAFTYSDRFIKVKDSFLFTRVDSLPVQEIEEISIRRSQLSRHWLGQATAVFLQAAIFYPIMVVINRPFPQWERKHFIQTGAVIVGGVLGFKMMSKSGWKMYKLWKGKWHLNHRIPLERSVVPIRK